MRKETVIHVSAEIVLDDDKAQPNLLINYSRPIHYGTV